MPKSKHHKHHVHTPFGAKVNGWRTSKPRLLKRKGFVVVR